jgi:hypothetical protein
MSSETSRIASTEASAVSNVFATRSTTTWPLASRDSVAAGETGLSVDPTSGSLELRAREG